MQWMGSFTGGAASAVASLATVGRAVPALISLAILLVLAGILIPAFLLPERLLLLGEQVAPLALVAIGQTTVVLIAGLDLSVGSVLTLSLVLGAGLAHGRNELLPLAILACLATGAAIGVANGLLVVRLRLPPLITTLSTATMAEGASWVYTNGAPNGSMPSVLQFAANGRWGIVPVADLIVALVFAAASLLLTRTVFGRRLYAMGANLRTAQLTGSGRTG